jgi:hypothetical protein
VTGACVALDTGAGSAFPVAQEDLLRAHVSEVLLGCRRNASSNRTASHEIKYVSGIVVLCVQQSRGVNEGEKRISAGHSPKDLRELKWPLRQD